MLPCSQRALILVLEHVGNTEFRRQVAAWLQPPRRQCTLFQWRSNVKHLCHKMTSASKMYAAMTDDEVGDA